MSSASIVTVNDLLSHREKKTFPNYKTVIPGLTDSVALIGYVHKELSFKLRDAIRPYTSTKSSNRLVQELSSLESCYLVRIFPKHYRSLRQLIS